MQRFDVCAYNNVLRERESPLLRMWLFSSCTHAFTSCIMAFLLKELHTQSSYVLPFCCRSRKTQTNNAPFSASGIALQGFLPLLLSLLSTVRSSGVYSFPFLVLKQTSGSQIPLYSISCPLLYEFCTATLFNGWERFLFILVHVRTLLTS